MVSITRLSGGVTPADGGDPRTFPAIWNDTSDDIEAGEYSKVPTGGAAGEVLVKQSGTDYDSAWSPLFYPSSGLKAGRYEHAVGTNTTGALVNGQLLATPFFFSRPVVLDRIGIRVTTVGSSGSVIRLGIYAADDDMFPAELVVDAGTVDSSDATGSKEITISESLPAGLYWMAIAGQGAPATEPVIFSREGNIAPMLQTSNNSNQIRQGGMFVTGVTGALDSSYGDTWDGTSNIRRPAVFVRIA